MWLNHPISEGNKTTKRVVKAKVGVGGVGQNLKKERRWQYRKGTLRQLRAVL